MQNSLMEPLLTRVDSVLFDLDGTLVETNIDFPLMKRQMIALAVDYGVDNNDLHKLDILAIIESSACELKSQGKFTEAAQLRDRAMVTLEEIEIHHANTTQEIPYAREVINTLRNEGIKIGVVTRNCRRASELSLEIACISLDTLICREDTEKHKPHPEQIYMALDILEAQACNSIMVGDHTMDIQSGKAAGLKTIGFLRDDRPYDFFDRIAPDFVAQDLKEVLNAIIRCDS